MAQKEGPLEAQDVMLAYQLLLGRPPESLAVVRYYQALPDLNALGERLIASSEFESRYSRLLPSTVSSLQIYAGYTPSDLDIFDAFAGPSSAPEPGFIIDFLGVRTRATYSPGFASYSGRVLGVPVPGDFHAETAEWLGLLKSVRSASRCYRAMELGAGWGPWLIAGATAARRLGISDLKLYGVEADTGRATFLEQHFADNGYDIAQHSLFRGAVGTTSGLVHWPVSDDSAADYGTRPVGKDTKDYRGREVQRVIDVTVFGINDLLHQEEHWNLLHVDVQGSEVEVCEAGLDEITARVAWVTIGTHSRLLEGQLHKLFRQAGWMLEHDKPAQFVFSSAANTLESMTTIDGTQVWRNPKFA